jgi:putative membrane protein
VSKSILSKFVLRWLVSGLGLWIAASLLGPSRLSVGGRWTTVVGAGFFLALVNMFLKPLLVFLSLPALLLTIGLFMLILNGFLILLASWIYDPLYVKNLGVAIVAGIIIGTVNFLVTRVLEDYKKS